jgi:hypothetical protein
MGAPRASTSANTLSIGLTVKMVTINTLVQGQATSTANTAICTDKMGTEVRVPLYTARAKGRLPAAGETWLVSQDIGTGWNFMAFYGTGPSDFQAQSGDIADNAIGPAQLVTDDWNSLAGLVENGWSIAADLPVSGYRMRTGDPTMMEIMADWACPSGGRADGTVIATLPKKYRPSAQGRLPCGVMGATGPRSDGAAPYLEFETAGGIQCFGMPVLSSGTMNVYVNGAIRLA